VCDFGSFARFAPNSSAETKWTRAAFVCYAAVLVNQVNSVWPPRIRFLGGVAEFVEHGWKFDSELAHARAGNERAFFLVLGSRKNNFFFYVALHLPHVTGMRFGDVHHQK